MKIGEIKKELQKYASEERKKTNEWFFKTGKGQYGEGDVFIGVRVPGIRTVAKKFYDAKFEVLEKLLYSKIHEERLLALLILVGQNKKIQHKIESYRCRNQVTRPSNLVPTTLEYNETLKIQKQILKFYLKHRRRINNWDLVDLSTHYILGQAILDGLEDEKILDKYSQSKNLWERRMSIVSTWIIIRTGNIKPTLRISKKLLGDKEDLIHKAVGWMLREAWKLGENTRSRRTSKLEEGDAIESEKSKKAQEQVEEFLMKNYNNLSRTTLRYAIERMEEKKRKRFLKGEF